jgi:hypothetical protein
MKQATLQFKTRIQNVDITNNNIEVQRVILNTILLVLGVLALFYVLILGNMVFNIVQRKALEKESLTLENSVGDLELSYLSISDSVDLSLSSSMGYKETHINYATRKALGSLKFNNNEI